MATNNHISNEQRDIIQNLLNLNKSFTYISNAIDKDRTAVSKEIRRNRYIKSSFYDPYDEKGINFALSRCKKLSKPPYVCNNCIKKNTCPLNHLYYNSKNAQQHYETVLSESRKGVNLTEEHIDEIEKIIVPLIKDKKQSVNQVYINHSDILDFCKVSFYNYVNDGVISLTNLDLPKKVKYKKRKVKRNTTYKRNNIILKGRKHDDYLKFISLHPKMNKVQLDTVIGQRNNRKCLLTMYLVDTHFMLIFLLDKKDSIHVTEVFKQLKETLSINEYRKIFRIILTDNGSEFFNPYEMEIDYEECKKITNVFYCNPYASYEKHELEVNHEYIRRVFPKGTSFANLNNDIVKRLQDNINAIPRNSLDGETPYNLTKRKYPNLIKSLKCKYIKPDDVDMSVDNIKGDKK